MRNAPLSAAQLSELEYANSRIVVDARVVLGAAALLMVLAQGVADQLAPTVVLASYVVFGLAARSRLSRSPDRKTERRAAWIDVAVYCSVIGMTGGADSRLLLFLLFPVVVLTFEVGLAPAVATALGALLAFAGINVGQAALASGTVSAASSPAPLLFVLAASLLVARWAQAEVILRQRAAFSSDLNRFCSPQHTLEEAIHALSALLRHQHEADSCLIVLQPASPAQAHVHIYDIAGDAPPRTRRLDETLGAALLGLPDEQAFVYSCGGLLRRTLALACRVDTMRVTAADRTVLQKVANLLDARCFMSLPVRSRSQTIGRCYLLSNRTRYARFDVQQLCRAIEEAGVMIENMQLAQRLSEEVVTEERRRISRDLHDGTIQPYIGLKLGLEALRRQVPAGAVAREVDELIHRAADGITELRQYVGALTDAERKRRRIHVLPVVRLQAAKFREHFGIETRVIAGRDIQVDSRLCEEITYIVREGLSNIRRHSAAASATLELEANDTQLLLRFRNGHGGRPAPTTFKPRSLSERVAALGGSVEVCVERETEVAARIPL